MAAHASLFAEYDPTLATKVFVVAAAVVIGIGLYHVIAKRASIKRPVSLFFYRREVVRGTHAVVIGCLEILLGVFFVSLRHA